MFAVLPVNFQVVFRFSKECLIRYYGHQLAPCQLRTGLDFLGDIRRFLDTDDYGVKAITKKEWEFFEDIKAPASVDLKTIMDEMLEPEPISRLDMKGKIEHKWLAADVKVVKKLPVTTGKSVKKLNNFTSLQDLFLLSHFCKAILTFTMILN